MAKQKDAAEWLAEETAWMNEVKKEWEKKEQQAAERDERCRKKEEEQRKALLEKEKEAIEKEKAAMEARWSRHVQAALAGDAQEKTLKKKVKAAVGQSPSSSKQKAAAPSALARAPISKPTTEHTPAVFQEPPPPPAPQLARPAAAVQEPPPVATLQAGPALTFPQSSPTAPFQTFQETDSDLAKKPKGWQAEERAKATLKCTKAEKEEQFRKATYEGVFKTQAGRDAMIGCFKAVVERHRKHERARSQMLLGTRPHSDQFKSKCFDEHMACIREECKDDASGNVFKALIENYHDEDYFSTDTDERIDKLAAFGYTGTTTMHSRTPSGTGSGSSESSVEAPAPFVDLTGGPLERAEKLPDLDRMVTMTDDMPEAPQAEKTPVKEMPPGSEKKKKSKQRRKAK